MRAIAMGLHRSHNSPTLATCKDCYGGVLNVVDIHFHMYGEYE